MDKAVLKKFAIESRKDLMQRMENKIKTFYIDEEFSKQQSGDVYILTNSKHSLNLSKEEYIKRELLIKRINELGLDQVIEEAAYTWFNRIVAIRYMEIHDYLPLTRDNQSLGIRVLSSKDNTPDPEIMKFTNLVNPELDIDFKKEKYVELKDDNEKFKYILLLVCRKLGRVIPQVFDGVTDYIDILIPDNLLNDTGFITKAVNEVPEEDYNQVEIIGWLYQYYISEKKDEVFADLKRNIKIKKENIPSATQIFTPDWIVKYMVENTLGRYTEDSCKCDFKYYVKTKTEAEEYKDLKNIKFLDPCCGSGHILVYAFELFYKIYGMQGYNKKDIPANILRNNLFGLDIDDRAGQLALLSVLLKAREFDRDIFNKNIIKEMNIMSIPESTSINKNVINSLCDESNKKNAEYLIDSFKDGKEIGSLLIIEDKDYTSLKKEINENNTIFGLELQKILTLIKCSNILSQKYDVVVTNPPYMGNRGMDNKLAEYVKKYYYDYKTDMFSTFIKQAYHFTKENGYYAMITQPTFLFISSFEKVREDLINKNSIISLLHMGRGIFGIDFGSTAFVIKKQPNINYCGSYYRLNKRTFQYIDVNDIEHIFLKAKDNLEYKFDFSSYKNNNEFNLESEDFLNNDDSLLQIKFETIQGNFNKIPGKPFAYWASDAILKIFEESTELGKIVPIRQGIATADNNKFLRLWFEVDSHKEKLMSCSVEDAKKSCLKWYPYNKGGAFRKWYGNNDYVVNWENDGFEIKNFKDDNGKLRSRPQNLDYCFKKSISWSLISSGSIAFRYKPYGHIFDIAGMSCFPDDEIFYYILGLNNTKIINNIMKFIAPTLNYQVGDIAKIPVIVDKTKLYEINNIVTNNIQTSKDDWDSFEASWEFKKHPLISEATLAPRQIKKEQYDGFQVCNNLEEAYNHWVDETNERFNALKKNEEELNDIFIKIYGLEDELSKDVEDKDITIRLADKEREIRSLISYAVGCMFGRYSLDKDGLIYAGGDFDNVYQKYKKTDGDWAGSSLSNYKYLNDNGNEIELSFEVDNDNIIPITDETYFSDDIVERFKTFIKTVYGNNTFNENMDFIAEALGKKGTETSEETIRRYFVNDFFNDHVKMYQKRPIYWLLDSGKKNGFKALIYMHRYNENLIPKARLDYLHRVQTTYEKLLSDVNYKLTTDLSMVDKKDAQKRQADLNAKLQEIKEYDEKIAHIANQRIEIDLDDGVKVNYERFKDILAKIK